MTSRLVVGRIVGALFLTVMVAYMIGVALIDPILAAPDVLTAAASSRSQVVAGALLELINGLAYVGIAVLVYPILRRYNESVALAYLAIRLMEFALQIVSDVSPLALLNLGQEFVEAGSPDGSGLQAAASSLIAVRYWSSQMVFLAYAVSAPFFYYAAYRLRLFSRVLAIWGLIGAPLVLVSVLLEMFELPSSLLLGAQMGLNEIVLGVWLLVRGFGGKD